jgi:hypothetical protein
MSHHRIENGIAQEFQTLIVQRLAFVIALADALVHERLTVILDVVRIKTEYLVKRRKKLLILAERELYSIYKIIQHIS